MKTTKKMNEENTYKRPENYIHIVSNSVGYLVKINDSYTALRLKEELMEIAEKSNREEILIDRLLNLDFNKKYLKWLESEHTRYKLLIKAYDNYISLLGEELDETVPIAHNRGWKSKRHKQGVEARKVIKALKEPEKLETDEITMSYLRELSPGEHETE